MHQWQKLLVLSSHGGLWLTYHIKKVFVSYILNLIKNDYSIIIKLYQAGPSYTQFPVDSDNLTGQYFNFWVWKKAIKIWPTVNWVLNNAASGHLHVRLFTFTHISLCHVEYCQFCFKRITAVNLNGWQEST